MARKTTKVRAVRRRSLFCTAIIALLLAIGHRAFQLPHFPIKEESEIGLPSLSGRAFNPTVSELRIWILGQENSTSYLLRLWTSWGGPVEGELAEMSGISPGFHARRLTVSRAWPAVLHELDQDMVWDLYEPTPTVLCISDSTMIIETYEYGQYRRVNISTIDNYTDPEAARNAEAIFDYVHGLAAESAQIAALAGPASIHC